MLSSSPSTSRKHTVPTHLNLPDQVLTLWSCNLTARQLLLLLVGGGISGDLWHALAVLSAAPVVGQGIRVVLALVIAWYRHAGRYLEVWCLVLLRYHLRPRRAVWRTLRACGPQKVVDEPMVPDADERGRRHPSTTTVHDGAATKEAA